MPKKAHLSEPQMNQQRILESALNRNPLAIYNFRSLLRLFLFLFFVTLLPQLGSAQTPFSKPVRLKSDSLVNPLGIDSRAPMLSWQLQDARMGARQTAYEIQVASSGALLAAGKSDVWDSGRCESHGSAGVGSLGPGTRCCKGYVLPR